MAITAIEKVESKTFTLEEYFKHEEKATQKSEFDNGKIIPMAGGTISHNDISGNIYYYLRANLEQNSINCRPFNSDQKIYIPPRNRSVYSDTCVVCGELKTYKGGNQAILNPTLIAEVSSYSTAGYDRREKFRQYKTLPTFQEYLLVDQEAPIVDVWSKTKEGDWKMQTFIGLDEIVSLSSINCKLKMADIYKNIPDLLDPQIAMAFEPEPE